MSDVEIPDEAGRRAAQIHADFVAALTPSDLTPVAVKMAQFLVLDAAACAYAALRSPLNTALTRWLEPHSNGARVLGHAGRYSPHMSAVANGSLIHALDFDDIPHFSAVQVPPLIALAPSTRATGADVLTAIVAGFEVAARITATLRHGGVQHPIGLVGPIGGAVTASKLLGATTEQTTMAIAIAASSGSGLLQNFGTFTKPLHAGRAAEAGLLATELAMAGWSADPAALDGPKGFFAAFCDPTVAPELSYDDLWIARLPADLSGGSSLDPASWPVRNGGQAADTALVGLGAPPDLTRGGPNLRRGPSFKPWAACGGNNAVLTAALELLDQPDINRDEIASIRVVVPSDPRNGALFRMDATNGLEGKFSLAFGVATAWLDGDVHVDSYTDAAYERVRNSGRLSRVDVVVDPEHIRNCGYPPADPTANWASVVATLADGTERTGWAFNRGVELDEAGVIGKFNEFAAPVLGEASAAEARSRVLNLADEPDWTELVDVLAGR